MHLVAIEREEPRQRAHDVRPLLREPRGRLLGRVDAEVIEGKRRCEPQQRQVVQDFQFVVHEREDGVPGLDLRHGIVQRHLAVAGKARERDREVLHQRRMHHVAEVDHADDLVAVRSGAQQVVGVTVAVHDLRAQCRQARQHVAHGARVKVRAQRLRIVRDPGLDARIQQQRALDVPGHEMPGVGMEQAAQTAREAGLECGDVPQRADRQRLALRNRHAREPAQQPHHVARAVRGGDPLAVVAALSRR